MGFSIVSQLYEAIAALALGMVSGVVYDILRIVRKGCNSKIVTALCDIIFSLFFCCSLFVLGFSLGSGEQRVFMTVFAVLSAALYFCLFSRFVCKLLSYIFQFLGKIIHIVVLPLIFLLELIKKFIFFTKNLFHYIKKWYTIKNTYRYFNSQKKRSRNPGYDMEGRRQ